MYENTVTDLYFEAVCWAVFALKFVRNMQISEMEREL
jgi:hypothetical protein